MSLHRVLLAGALLLNAPFGFLTLLRAQTAKPAALRVASPIVSQFEDGPPVPVNEKLIPGETVSFSFLVDNYKVGDNGKIRLTGHVQAFDSRGIALAVKDELQIATTLGSEDKNFKPKIHSQFQIPPIAPGGKYIVRFDVKDEQTEQTATGETAFGVSGEAFESTPALTVRALHFYRTQDDEVALKVAAYRPGDMVWVRFEVAGYKYGEQNAIDVSYDVAVITAEGKTLYSQENAAVEKSQAYYPQPWVPGNFALTLQNNMRPGPYTLQITARDAMGNQTAQTKAEFRLEQ